YDTLGRTAHPLVPRPPASLAADAMGAKYSERNPSGRSGLSHHQSVPITRRFSTDSSLWPMDRGTGNHRAGWHPAVFLLVVLGLCGCLWPKHAFCHHLLATRTQPELAQSHHSVPCLSLIRDPMVSRRLAGRVPDAYRKHTHCTGMNRTDRSKKPAKDTGDDKVDAMKDKEVGAVVAW